MVTLLLPFPTGLFIRFCHRFRRGRREEENPVCAQILLCPYFPLFSIDGSIDWYSKRNAWIHPWEWRRGQDNAICRKMDREPCGSSSIPSFFFAIKSAPLGHCFLFFFFVRLDSTLILSSSPPLPSSLLFDSSFSFSNSDLPLHLPPLSSSSTYTHNSYPCERQQINKLLLSFLCQQQFFSL